MKQHRLAIESLVGLRKPKSYLRGRALSGGALLFIGPSGCGKTETAKIYSQIVNCSSPDMRELRACGRCAACRDNRWPIHFNVGEVTPLDVRKKLQLAAQFTAAHRVTALICDEVHLVPERDQTSLHRMIDQLPDHVLFIATTHISGKLSEAFLSRFQVIEFRRPSRDDLLLLASAECSKLEMNIGDAALLKLVIQANFMPRLLKSLIRIESSRRSALA